MEVVQVDIGDLDGSTPLMYAAENGGWRPFCLFSEHTGPSSHTHTPLRC